MTEEEFKNFIVCKINELANKYCKTQYFTLSETAKILKVSNRTLSTLVANNLIPCYRIPSVKNEKARYRFKLNDIEAFMENNKVKSINNIVKNAFHKEKIKMDKSKINQIIKTIVMR